MTDNSFAAAQERIIARQAQRQIEAENATSARAGILQESSLARLPYPLNRSAAPLASFWSTLVNSEGTRPAFRVGQVDAELLDEELLSLLRGQVGDALKYFGTHIQEDWSNEIILGLRAILFKLSVWDHDASYGASLQNLRYADARKQGAVLQKPTNTQKSLYGLITVLGRYGWDKWESWLIDQEGGYTELSSTTLLLSRITDRLSTVHSVAAFASFIIFLVNGRYRTLTDRLLGLRLISPVNQVNREVSFEYLNRQLVWHAFTEFLLFLLPLVGISRWRKWLSRAWKRTKMALQADAETEDTDIKQGPLAFLPERSCPICYQDQNPTSTSEAEILGANTGAGGGVIGSAATDIVNPYETVPCGCIYCFVCITSKIEAEEGGGWPCLRCGDLVYKCKPWSGDIIAEKPAKNGTKNVGFAMSNKDDGRAEEKQHLIADQRIPSELGSSQWTLEGDTNHYDDG